MGKCPFGDGNTSFSIAEGAFFFMLEGSAITSAEWITRRAVSGVGVNFPLPLTLWASDVVVGYCRFHAFILTPPTGSARKMCRKWVAI